MTRPSLFSFAAAKAVAVGPQGEAIRQNHFTDERTIMRYARGCSAPQG